MFQALAGMGAIFQMQGQSAAARSEANAADKNAQMLDEQAYELMRRYEINASNLKREGERLFGKQAGAYAKGGVSLNSGSTLSVLEDTAFQNKRNELILRQDAEFKAKQIRAGAQMFRDQVGDIRKANKYQQMNTIFSFGTSAYSANK